MEPGEPESSMEIVTEGTFTLGRGREFTSQAKMLDDLLDLPATAFVIRLSA